MELIEDRFLRDDVFPINHDFALWLSRSNLYYSQFKENLDDYSTRIILAAAQMGDLAPYAVRIPEIYTRQVPIGDVLRYLQSVREVSVKYTGAAQWILETGLFLNDDIFPTKAEIFLKESLDRPDLLRTLVSQTVVQDGDYERARSLKPLQDGSLGYLEDDLQSLSDIPSEVEDQIASIVWTSATDYQVRKAVCLIDEYGIPGQGMFDYKIPHFNTQLQVLVWLIQDQTIPEEYHTLALSAAMAYGTLLTIGNEQVRQETRKYVGQLLAFAIETDRILEERGCVWQAKHYSLEASIGLIYGAEGEQIILLGARPEQPYVYPWLKVYLSRQMTLEEFESTFIGLDTLRDMQQWLIGKGLLRENDLPKLANDVDGIVPAGDGSDPSLDLGAAKRNAIESLWEDTKNAHTIKGDCGSRAHVECSLLQSICISKLYGRYYDWTKDRLVGHVFAAYFEPPDGAYREPTHNIYIGQIGTGYCKYPWDNLRTEKGVRSLSYSNKAPTHSKWFRGDPAGYMFRKSNPMFSSQD